MLLKKCAAAFMQLLLYQCLLHYDVTSAHVFHNTWATHIPSGETSAKFVAEQLGFSFRGQIGSLDNFFLFEHRAVRKRSTRATLFHHKRLLRHKQITWAEQQVAKRRVKRDFSTKRTPGAMYTSNLKDPLWPKQWYLNKGALGSEDMRVRQVWERGYSGKGVVVTILDDGIEHSHGDLAVNYDPQASRDINDNDDNPEPRYTKDDTNRHGTRCAGEVAAQANNSLCVVGVAFNARIGGVRMLDGDVTDAVEARSLSLNPQHVDIYSASWGPDDNGQVVDGPAKLARQAFAQGVVKGRNGKGNIFVWASGNGGSYKDSCNADGYTNSIFTLSISSTSEAGTKPWYLEECSSTLASTYSSGENYHDKQVVTTDLRNKCTEEHTGTSASAPMAAGIIALVLEANPELGWRDVQYLTLMTARPEPMVDGEWIVNGVGRKVSHRYGYGLMDANAMIDLAVEWINVPPQKICTGEHQRLLVNRYITGKRMKSRLTVDGCDGDPAKKILYLEHVQAKVNLHYSRRGELKIFLTSPNGTRSTLLPPRTNDVERGAFDHWPFMSVHFWGEAPNGTWELELLNTGHYDNTGYIVDWELVLYGVDTNPERRRSDVTTTSTYVTPTSCPYFNLQSSTCVTACPNATYVTNSTCHACHSTCAECFAAGSESCTRCEGSLFLLEVVSSCVVLCPEGYAADMDTQRCISCLPPCVTCEGSPHSCTRCMPGSQVHHGTCVSSCPRGQYLRKDNSCDYCDKTCASCFGPGLQQCLTCLSGFTLSNSSCSTQPCSSGQYLAPGGMCRPCHVRCAQCKDSSYAGCTQCSPNSVLHDGQCIASCPQRHYMSHSHDDVTECLPCHSSCLTCSGGTQSSCLSCQDSSLSPVSGFCFGTTIQPPCPPEGCGTICCSEPADDNQVGYHGDADGSLSCCICDKNGRCIAPAPPPPFDLGAFLRTRSGLICIIVLGAIVLVVFFFALFALLQLRSGDSVCPCWSTKEYIAVPTVDAHFNNGKDKVLLNTPAVCDKNGVAIPTNGEVSVLCPYRDSPSDGE